MQLAATFYNDQGEVIGQSTLRADDSDAYWHWWLHHSHLFYCERCGRIYGRIEVIPPQGKETSWHAHRGTCKSHGSDHILEVLQWEEHPNHLTFYPATILQEIFLSELSSYERGN